MGRFIRLSKTAWTMCLAIAALFALLLAGGVFVIRFAYAFEPPNAYAAGLALGCLLSAAKVILLERALGRACALGKMAPVYATAQALLRYLLTIAVLLAAVVFPGTVGLVGMILGVLALQPAAFITGGLLKNAPL